MKTAARMFFVSAPALCVGACIGAVFQSGEVFVFASLLVAALGLHVTEVKPERGER